MIPVVATNIIESDAILQSFKSFEHVASPVLHIHNKSRYRASLDLLTTLLETATDDPDSPENCLIELVAGAIERYEKNLPEVRDWQRKADETSSDVAMLRLLMNQYGLAASDFENEIGKKSYISQILSGKKRLTRNHIEKLSSRFSISPALFFG